MPYMIFAGASDGLPCMWPTLLKLKYIYKCIKWCGWNLIICMYVTSNLDCSMYLCMTLINELLIFEGKLITVLRLWSRVHELAMLNKHETTRGIQRSSGLISVTSGTCAKRHWCFQCLLDLLITGCSKKSCCRMLVRIGILFLSNIINAKFLKFSSTLRTP